MTQEHARSAGKNPEEALGRGEPGTQISAHLEILSRSIIDGEAVRAPSSCRRPSASTYGQREQASQVDRGQPECMIDAAGGCDGNPLNQSRQGNDLVMREGPLQMSERRRCRIASRHRSTQHPPVMHRIGDALGSRRMSPAAGPMVGLSQSVGGLRRGLKAINRK